MKTVIAALLAAVSLSSPTPPAEGGDGFELSVGMAPTSSSLAVFVCELSSQTVECWSIPLRLPCGLTWDFHDLEVETLVEGGRWIYLSDGSVIEPLREPGSISWAANLQTFHPCLTALPLRTSRSSR